MKSRPILFSAPMVRALLDGSKTQTRRMMKPQPNAVSIVASQSYPHEFVPWKDGQPHHSIICPHGDADDELWVRETHYVWSAGNKDGTGRRIDYRASEPLAPCTWTSAIFTPRWASRITLRITAVRAERLQDISETDAKAEGASFHNGGGIGHSGWRHDYKDVHADARSSYARFWKELNGAESWDANPWLWVISFERIRP